jgi:uncharacterized protein (TIGR03067 family)
MSLKRAHGLAALSLFLPCVEISAQRGAASPANQPTNAALERLQGTWQGVMLGQESTAITITISRNSFHFHRDTNFWFDTTITLPPGTDPQQLHATIKSSADSQDSAVGEVVVAIFKIQGETLALATSAGSPEETPTRFDDEKASRYELRMVPPPKKHFKLLEPK